MTVAMRFLRAGSGAVLVEVAGLDQVTALHAALRDDPPPGTVDLVPAARTVLVVFDEAVPADDVISQIRTRRLPDAAAAAGTVVRLPVVYDGADLSDVAAHTGLSEREVVARHVAARYRVAFCGFAPGFGYLTGGDPALRVPRRADPRTRVPAGSVALADEFTGVYPREMPGGWQLIGRTDVVLFDVDRQPPALLAPGARVEFVEQRP